MRRRLTKIRHKNFMLTSAVSRFINAKRRTASCGFLALFFMTEQVAPTPSSRLPGCFVQVFSANNFFCFISNHTDKLSPVFGRPQGSPWQAYSTHSRANDSLSQLRRQFPLRMLPWAYRIFQAISERFFKKKLQAKNRVGFKNRHYQNAFFENRLLRTPKNANAKPFTAIF